MAGNAQNIRAGSAFVELLLKNNAFIKGLSESSRRLKSFGGGVAKIGAAITAVGAIARGSLLAAVYKFAESGDALAKMSQRTGVSAKALSELGFAAEQSGQDISVLETSLKRMQKTVGAALEGNGEAAKSFAMIGLGLDQLQGKSPDKQFEAIAEALSKVHDPTMRAAHAMAIFGRSGTDLLPLMLKGAKGIQALREEAQDLGLSKSDGDVKAAEGLSDAFKILERVVGGLSSKIGAALAPDVRIATDLITKIAVASGKWIKQNRSLFVTISSVATGLLVAGAAITAVGTAIAIAGIALGGFASAMSAVGALGAASAAIVLSPLALVAAALVAGAWTWTKFGASGKTAFNTLSKGLGSVLKISRETFGGIADAIQGGDLALAGQIAMAGLKLAWLVGTNSLRMAWNDFSKSIGLDEVIVSVKSSWQDLQFFLSSSFIDLEVSWADTMTKMEKAWGHFTQISKTLWTGYSAGLRALWNEASGALYGEDDQVIGDRTRAIGREMLSDIDAIDAKAKTDQAEIAANGDVRKKRLVANQKGAHKALEDDYNRSKRGAHNVGSDQSSGDRAASEQIAKGVADFLALREKAAAAKREADRLQAERDAELSKTDKTAEPEHLGREVVGSFSAAALAAGGASTAPIERVAKGVEKHVAVSKEQKALQLIQNKILGDSLTQLKLAGQYK